MRGVDKILFSGMSRMSMKDRNSKGKENKLWKPTKLTDKIGETILSGIIRQDSKDRNRKGKDKWWKQQTSVSNYHVGLIGLNR